MAKHDDETARARQDADDNLRRSSGRDQATKEHAVDVAERDAERGAR
jgi:hypothetical protein